MKATLTECVRLDIKASEARREWRKAQKIERKTRKKMLTAEEAYKEARRSRVPDKTTE
jgi:hypothetical protein